MLLPSLRGSAHRGCFCRLADSTGISIYIYVLGACARCMLSRFFPRVLSLSVLPLGAAPRRAGSITRRLLSPSRTPPRKRARPHESACGAEPRGRKRDATRGRDKERTSRRDRGRERARARGRRSERGGERCVGSDRSSSFEARQRTSEQPRNGTAIVGNSRDLTR